MTENIKILLSVYFVISLFNSHVCVFYTFVTYDVMVLV